MQKNFLVLCALVAGVGAVSLYGAAVPKIKTQNPRLKNIVDSYLQVDERGMLAKGYDALKADPFGVVMAVPFSAVMAHTLSNHAIVKKLSTNASNLLGKTPLVGHFLKATVKCAGSTVIKAGAMLKPYIFVGVMVSILLKSVYDYTHIHRHDIVNINLNRLQAFKAKHAVEEGTEQKKMNPIYRFFMQPREIGVQCSLFSSCLKNNIIANRGIITLALCAGLV